MPTLNLDTAGSLDIIIAQGQSFTIEIDHFESDGTTPLPIIGTVKMKIIIPASGKVIKTLDAVVASNKITISQTDAENTLGRGDYSYHIVADQAAGASLPLWKGKLTVNPYPA